MSGLTKFLPGFGKGYDGQVSQADIDQYDYISIDTPSVNFGWFGTSTSATASSPAVLVNQLPDWPRNIAYSVTGVAGGMGGTFTGFGTDQFGLYFSETVTIGSAAGGGTAYGTAIAAKFGGGTFSPSGLGGTAVGTFSFGLGTAAGTAGNYFGLLTKLGGTGDVKSIVWISTSTPTTLNKGTSFGSLVNTTSHSFQGTSGVAATDHYRVIMKPSFDNSSLGTMSGL